MLGLILFFTTLASIVSLLLVSLLLVNTRISKSVSLNLINFAVGVLLATAFLDLFPEAIERANSVSSVLNWSLGGMVAFFFFEQSFRWYHHHRAHGDIKPSVLMVTFGDAIHNFIDGVAISAAFLTNLQLGIVTSFAVFAHEIPHEIADVSIYLNQGLTKKKTIIFNVISGLTALVGAITTYFFASAFETHLPIILAFTAGNFIYIASSDLIPELHHASEKKVKIWLQLGMFLVGIIAVMSLRALLG